MRVRSILICWLFSGLAWAQAPVEVHFQADPPVLEVVLEGQSYPPIGRNTFRLPIRADSNIDTKRATLMAGGGISSQMDLPRPQEATVTLPVEWEIHSRPWLVLLLLPPLALFVWLRRRSRGARTAALELQQQQSAPLEVDPRFPLVGQSLGEYVLEAPLGQGGMATVYRGRGSDGRAVAVKVISTETETVEFRTRFEREIQVSHTLKHPNVVEVLSWGQDEQRVYLVLELIDGRSLRDLLPAEGFPLEQAVKLSESICAALEYAHDKGVVHRDLKPDNVMVTQEGRVKLMDFGLARDHEVQTVTMTGQALGTPNYMPPEQVLEKASKATLNPRSDQYSLAVTVYELLCGGLPYNGENAVAVIGKHMYDQPESLLARRPDLPAPVEGVIFRALAKDPQARYASVAEFRQALRAATL